MTVHLTIEDKTTVNFKSPGLIFVVAVPEAQVTVRELIRARVTQEVNDYNTRQPEFFRTLIQPDEAEVTLNGFRLPVKRVINCEAQINKAFQAFKGNGFLILVNGHQAETLDDVIDITPTTSVSFLKLVPLVGG